MARMKVKYITKESSVNLKIYEIAKKKDRNHSSRAGIKSLFIHQREYFLGNEQAKNGIIDWDITEKKTDNLLKTVGLRLDPNTLVSTNRCRAAAASRDRQSIF